MDERLPVITLWRPWSDWVVLGWKTIETRTHERFKSLLGKRIGIHSGLKWDTTAVMAAYKYMTDDQRLQTMDFSRDKSAGRIICTAMVKDFALLSANASPAALIECGSRRFGLFLTHVSRTPDEPWTRIKGAQGIQYVDVPEIPVKISDEYSTIDALARGAM